jgi:hypothetical protein
MTAFLKYLDSVFTSQKDIDRFQELCGEYIVKHAPEVLESLKETGGIPC